MKESKRKKARERKLRTGSKGKTAIAGTVLVSYAGIITPSAPYWLSIGPVRVTLG